MFAFGIFENQIKKINILIVDDKPNNLTVLEAVLDSPKYNLIHATSGFEAVDLAVKTEFALILLDVQMPGKDGFITAQEIRKAGASKDSPIIFLTAIYGDDMYVNLGYTVGAVDYIFKPFNPHILKSKVEVFVDLFIKSKQLIEISTAKEMERMLRRSEMTQQTLIDVGAYLAASALDYEKTLAKIAEISLEKICEWCEIYLVDGNGELQLKVATEEKKEADFEIAQRAVSSKVSEMGKIKGTPYFYMCIPLTVRDHILGSIILGSYKREFTRGDFDFAKEFIFRAAIALDNALLYNKAEKAILTRDEFLSIASHELRTPLTPLKIQIQSLAKAVATGRFASLTQEQLLKTIQRSNRQLDRLNNVIEDLLNVSRINLGRMKLELKHVNLSRLVKEVVDQFNDQLLSAGCQIDLNLNPEAEGEWDPTKIEQVMINLLTNAIKYAHGNPIHIQVEDLPKKVRLSIKDHGIGISLADQDRIFDLFERTQQAKNYGGLGLGLYIVRNIVQVHGGSIKVESKLGQGAKFILELPKKSVIKNASNKSKKDPQMMFKVETPPVSQVTSV